MEEERQGTGPRPHQPYQGRELQGGVSISQVPAHWRDVPTGASPEGDEGCRSKKTGSRCADGRGFAGEEGANSSW
jgi:hypothetical protein